MQHAAHPQIVDVGEAPRHLGRDIDAPDRLADDRVVLRVLELRRLGVVELDLEHLAADQLAIADAAIAGADDAVGHAQLFRLGVEALRRLLDQRRARGRRRVADLHAAGLDGEAAPGRALVGRERGIALDDAHGVERHVELLGGHLRERGAHAGAEIDLAGIDRDAAARVDGEERVDLGDRQRPLRRRLLGERCRGAEREADDQRAAALEQIAP